MSQPAFEGALGASGRYALGFVTALGLGLGGMLLVRHAGAGKGAFLAALLGPLALFIVVSALLLPKVTFVIEEDALVLRMRSVLRPRPRERRIPWWDVVDARYEIGTTNQSGPVITVRRVDGETVLIVGQGSTADVCASLQRFHGELLRRLERER